MSTPESQCRSEAEARTRIADTRYVIEEFVGQGGMACVYKAREKGTPNIYALKLLKDQFRQHEEFLQIFEREAEHMRDLQYPNIVRFYKFVVEEDAAYIIMEYVDGFPLKKYIRRAQRNDEPFPVSEVVRIMAQIARAISYIHQEGYIHYDIKPGNVLLRSTDGRAYLTDLGITNAFGSADVLPGAGTPAYMPYEQQAGELSDFTVDIYALAVMIFEMLAGQKPFIVRPGLDAYTARDQFMRMHEMHRVPAISKIRPELPQELDEVFYKAMAKKRYNRYQDVMQFAQDVHQALLPLVTPDLRDFENIQQSQPMMGGRLMQPDTISTPLQVTPPTPSAQRLPTRSLILIAAAVVVLIVALMIFAFNSARQTPPPSLSPAVAAATEEAAQTEPAVVLPQDTATTTNTATSTNTATATLTQTHTATATDTPTASATVTDTPSPTLTHTATATSTPTATQTASATPTHTITPSPTNTATPLPTEPPASRATLAAEILDSPAFPLPLEDPFGMDESAEASVQFLAQRNNGIVPLQVGDVRDFALEMSLPEGNASQYTSYGLIFHMQDEANFLRFRVLSDAAIWRFEEIAGGEIRVLEEGIITADLPSQLVVRGIGANFVVQYDENIVTLQAPANGSRLALWLEHDNPAQIIIDQIAVALLGDAAIAAEGATPTPAPVDQQPLRLFLQDLQDLRASAEASGDVSCDVFNTQIAVLELYDQWEATAPLARNLLESSAILISRCQSANDGEVVSFQDIITDFLDWEAILEETIRDVQGMLGE